MNDGSCMVFESSLLIRYQDTRAACLSLCQVDGSIARIAAGTELTNHQASVLLWYAAGADPKIDKQS